MQAYLLVNGYLERLADPDHDYRVVVGTRTQAEKARDRLNAALPEHSHYDLIGPIKVETPR